MPTDTALFGDTYTTDVTANTTATVATLEIPANSGVLIWLRCTICPTDNFGLYDYINYQQEYVATRSGTGSVSSWQLASSTDGTFAASISTSNGATALNIQGTASTIEDTRFIVIVQALTNTADS